jgi:hypothetical protein
MVWHVAGLSRPAGIPPTMGGDGLVDGVDGGKHPEMEQENFPLRD